MTLVNAIMIILVKNEEQLGCGCSIPGAYTAPKEGITCKNLFVAEVNSFGVIKVKDGEQL